MKKLICAAACGLGALAAAAEEAPTTRAPYVTAAIMQAAGVDLKGEGLPGEGVAYWMEKPTDQVVFLQGEWDALLGEVKRLGDVSVLTGNEALMNLASGTFERFEGGDGRAIIVSKGIDLRFFLGRWKYAAAILPASGSVPGIAFFDGAGVPVFRVLLTETSNTAEFDAIVAQYKGEKPALALETAVPKAAEAPSEETKVAFLEGWRKLQDTHEFSGLLRDHKVSRTEALRIAEGEFTAQLDPATYGALFEQLVDQEVAIMIFALNDGCVQIGTGVINELNRARGTLQLAEDDSRTLIKLDGVKEVWRVSKPTERGQIHSLELYDGNGEALAYLFGSEKGDSTSIVKWKDLLFALPLKGEGAVKVAGEAADAKAASSEEEVKAEGDAAPKVDLVNMPRRLRSQISYTVKRMLEFDKNGDALLAQEELPGRMAGLVARGDQNGDAFLDKDELTAMSWRQIEKREAKAEAEPIEKH